MTLRELIELIEKLLDLIPLAAHVYWERFLDLHIEDAIIVVLKFGFAACVALIVAGVIWDHWPSIKGLLGKENLND